MSGGRLFLALNARFAHQRGRALLSAAGIALGVALGFGVHLVNRAAVGDLEAAVRSAAGEADLEVRGGRAGFPEEVFVRLSKVPGVSLASPVLELEARVAGRERPLRLLGIDSLRAARMQPQLFADEPGRILGLLRPDMVFLSASAAENLNLHEKEKLKLVNGLEIVELEVAGVLPSGALHGAAALADIATVQWRFGRIGMLNRIDVRISRGFEAQSVKNRIANILPPGVHVSTVEVAEQSAASLSRSYRVNLEVLALVALFTGGFLVFSAQALEVARRRGEHALLRVLGLERRGIARLVLAEAGVIGVAGSALGLALGYGFALAAVRFAGADLGAGMFRGLHPELHVSALAALLYAGAGVAVALAGALLPALDAARAAPAQALKAGDEQRALEKGFSLLPGALLFAVALVLAQLGPVNGIPLFGYAAIACLLVGGIVLMPWFSQKVFGLEVSVRSVPISLAAAQLRGAPGQAMVSLAAIVASFSLMVSMAIMIASFRQSVDDWLDAVLPADLYFRTTFPGETAFLEPEMESRIRALPQVARAEFVRSSRVSLDAARPQVVLIARDGVSALAVQKQVSPQPGYPPAWISEALADVYGFSPGEKLVIPLQGKPRQFVVAGVWRDYARQQGSILVLRKDYAALTGDRRANDGALWLAPGADAADAAAALRALPGGAQLEIAEPSEIRAASLRLFDRSFAVTYAMEAVAVLVGLFGLSSSLGAIVLARRREFGMLRHLGMTRGQIGAMLAAEGGLLALIGAAAGLALGGAISLVLIRVVNRQSFHWSMDFHVPASLLLALTFVLVLLSVLTALASGREAMALGAVRAVKEDW